ncbi:MAG TPA: hypothetical protein VKR56_07795 [Candidatus Cybelea sp.]|jgi:hypothetical protein|nr:hypothetical protein [Candidatus Cybelea sp.]
MSSLSSIHEGTISARPLHSEQRGRLDGREHRVTGSHEIEKSGMLHGCDKGGMLHGSSGSHGRSLRGESSESPEKAAMAEVNGLISSLGSLSNQAQSLPLSPPTLPGLPQNQGYQPQPLDYAFDGSN